MSQRTILDVLFPKVRAKLLQVLFTVPVKQRYVRELAFMSRLDLHTVHDELRRLSAVGLLTSWSNGYHRFYQPNREHPLYLELCHVVERAGNFHLRETRSCPGLAGALQNVRFHASHRHCQEIIRSNGTSSRNESMPGGRERSALSRPKVLSRKQDVQT